MTWDPGELSQPDALSVEPHVVMHEGGGVDEMDLSTLKAFTDLQATVAALQAVLDVCIMIFNGALTDIPSGWQLCDGSNGTRDLRDKFIVGAGSTYPVGTTGGSDTQILSHDNNHDSVITGLVGGNVILSSAPSGAISTTAAAHTHTGHSNHSFDNRPPYYALAYIQKVP